MENLLVKLMLAAALTQLGVSASDFLNPQLNLTLTSIERGSRDILQINWKPISTFPEEAKRFR